MPTLSATLNDHCFLSDPVVRRDTPDPVLHAMFDAIGAEPIPAKGVRLRKVSGPMAEVLSRVLTARQSRLVTVRQRVRPVIEKKNAQTTFNDVFPSAKQRKGLRRHRKRLSEIDDVIEASYRDPADIAAAAEEFLSLEALGWKGSNRTALACKTDDANFTRSWLATLAVTGDLRIETLRINGNAIAMTVWASCGDWAFVWKTCYDEKFSRYSPGVLLLEQGSRRVLADNDLKFVDSCSSEEKGMIGRYWKDTMPVADVIFDVRRGGSFVTSAMARLDKGLVNCKDLLWLLYRRWRSLKPSS